MNIVSNEKVNFNSLEENIYKKMMELGRKLIQDELRMIDELIKKEITIKSLHIVFLPVEQCFPWKKTMFY